MMIGMKKEGLDLEEIALKTGLSEYQVANVFSSINGGRSALLKSKYPVLASWQMVNGVSLYRLCKEIGISQTAGVNLHTGNHDPSKYVIDKVLRYTGMMYEEIFLERKAV